MQGGKKYSRHKNKNKIKTYVDGSLNFLFDLIVNEKDSNSTHETW